MKDYEVKMAEASRELTAREKIRFRDFSAAVAIDASIADDRDPGLTIEPIVYAVFDVHNEHAEHPDYRNYMIEDKSGIIYITSSSGAFTRFQDIFDTMKSDSPDEDFTVTFYKKPSNKYKGKFMLLCKLD